MSTSPYRPTGLGALNPRPKGALKDGARRAFWSAPKGGGLSCEAMKGEGSRSSRYIPLFGGSPTAIKAGANSSKFRVASRIVRSFPFPNARQSLPRKRPALSFLQSKADGRGIPDFECGPNDEHFT